MRNMRSRHGAPDHEFQVLWNQARARFDVWRDGVPTSAHAPGRSAALSFAIREARQETILTGRFIIVSSRLDGRRKVEWDGLAVS